MTTLLSEGKTPEDIINDIFSDEEIEITDKQNVQYYCNCSREKIEKVVIALGKKELEDIINQDHKITLKCHFCGKEYTLTEDELKELIKEA